MTKRRLAGHGTPSRARPQSVQTGLGSFLRAHLTVIFAGLAFLLTAIRVMAISNLNPVTAMAVLQNVGIGTVLIGTIVALLPICLLVGLLVPLVWRQVPGLKKPHKLAADVCLAFLGVLIFFVVPWRLLLQVALPFALLMVGGRVLRGWRRRRGRPETKPPGPLSQKFFPFELAYVALAVIYTILVAQPWFAPELVETSDGSHMTGFVLSANSDQTVVMRFQDRRIVYVDGPVHRTVCGANVFPIANGPSLYRLLSPEPDYVPCARAMSLNPHKRTH